MKITAIVGSYRKGGTVDTVVDALLAAAGEAGAEVVKIYLIDKHIAYCTNCRDCTQEKGLQRGACPITDDMEGILQEIESSDAIVLGASINFYTVTAVMKTFIERLICFAYWPWGMLVPKVRNRKKDKRAVVIISSASPALLARLQTGVAGLMKNTAAMLGAGTTDVLSIGIAARSRKQQIRAGVLKKAKLLGRKLAAGAGRMSLR